RSSRAFPASTRRRPAGASRTRSSSRRTRGRRPRERSRADRNLLVGRRRAVEALVPTRAAAEGPPPVLRRALLDGRGRFDVLPRARREDGARLGRADAGLLRHAREGVRADDAAPGEARTG